MTFNSLDIVARKTGLRFKGVDKIVRCKDAITYYIGELSSKQGIGLMRAGVADEEPHWPGVGNATLGWKFLKQFRRNVKTGDLMYEKGTSFFAKQ